MPPTSWGKVETAVDAVASVASGTPTPAVVLGSATEGVDLRQWKELLSLARDLVGTLKQFGITLPGMKDDPLAASMQGAGAAMPNTEAPRPARAVTEIVKMSQDEFDKMLFQTVSKILALLSNTGNGGKSLGEMLSVMTVDDAIEKLAAARSFGL